MAAVDAQFYWMSAKLRNDDFMIYAFDAEPADCERAIARVLRRASECPELTIRVREGSRLTYPEWVPTDVTPDQAVRHDLADRSWNGCLGAVVDLASDQLDMRRMAWRIHVFTPVSDIPGVAGPGAVVVLQMPHALADGIRATAMAAWLFGRAAPVPTVPRRRTGFPPLLAVDAARTHRRLVRDTQAGILAPGVGHRPLLPINARPGAVRSIRTLVRQRSQLSGPTVTVSVLTAMSAALSGLLGDAADSLGAEVPMAKPGARLAFNHFGNVTVGLYPGLRPDARAARIAADLANGRRRFEHPATRASDRAFAAVPAPLLRWGVDLFDPEVRPAQMAGNTAVSSLNRGPADLTFGDARVVLAAGNPALSSLMGLSHGVHGIGDTVAVTVHAAESAVPDIDAYARLLDEAL